MEVDSYQKQAKGFMKKSKSLKASNFPTKRDAPSEGYEGIVIKSSQFNRGTMKQTLNNKRYGKNKNLGDKSNEAYSIYKGQPVTTCSEIGSASEQLLRLNSKGRKIRYNKKQTKSSKRGRLANQQAVQMLGDKISASSDAANFVSNFQSRAARASNFENFISMSSHYGTNRGVMHPSFDFQKHGSISEKSFSKIHKKSEDGRSLYNHPLITSNNQTAGRDTSAEEIKTGKYRSGHSPLLTKRKHSQKNGNSTSRSKFKHSKNKSKLISLNSNLRQSS